ncbi:hypothetical protein D3C76_916400 [compost metagenome]
MRVLDAQLFDEQRCPGQASANPTGEGDGTHHQACLGIKPEDLGHAHAQRVLQEDEHGGEHQQDHQRPPTLDQLAHVRLQADAGKEVQQHGVANLQVKFDLDVETEVQNAGDRRTDKTADHRFGNAVLAQQGAVLDQRLAQEEQQDSERETHQAMNSKELGGHL